MYKLKKNFRLDILDVKKGEIHFRYGDYKTAVKEAQKYNDVDDVANVILMRSCGKDNWRVVEYLK